MIQLKVTEIKFDFNDDYGFTVEEEEELTESYKNEVIQSVLDKVYTVDCEDEIADVITDETGWCVEEVFYEIV
jgi:hypothetical protein